MRKHPAAVAALCTGLLLLTGCTQAAQPAQSTSTPTTTVTVTPAAPETFGAVGDSITAGLSGITFGGGTIDPNTWVAQLPGTELAFKNGWAVPGATTQMMRDGVAPIDADVLVVMAGTNDVQGKVPLVTSEANLVATVRIAGGDTVFISAIPPSNRVPAQAAAYNTSMANFARLQGWHWIDPWVGVRNGQNYKVGATVDGVHPVPAAAQLAGQAIRADVLAVTVASS